MWPGVTTTCPTARAFTRGCPALWIDPLDSDCRCKVLQTRAAQEKWPFTQAQPRATWLEGEMSTGEGGSIATEASGGPNGLGEVVFGLDLECLKA